MRINGTVTARRSGVSGDTGFSVLCDEGTNLNSGNHLRRAVPPVAAQGQRATPNPPPDLAQVIDAWPALPDPIKAAVLALVRNAA
jgi:hypothetical protein